mmetsp:Transcript_70335/g.164789  ORF Transcript_70335/g.164789 Transcript_70335/m.164789 type:complete len:208 (-) Transcript_70335:754-1377(-)
MRTQLTPVDSSSPSPGGSAGHPSEPSRESSVWLGMLAPSDGEMGSDRFVWLGLLPLRTIDRSACNRLTRFLTTFCCSFRCLKEGVEAEPASNIRISNLPMMELCFDRRSTTLWSRTEMNPRPKKLYARFSHRPSTVWGTRSPKPIVMSVSQQNQRDSIKLQLSISWKHRAPTSNHVRVAVKLIMALRRCFSCRAVGNSSKIKAWPNS